MNKQCKEEITIFDMITIFIGILNGFLYMHSKYILHNDIKAYNMTVCPCLKPKIIDFGEATLKTEPVVYNLSKEETEKYNCYDRHLAYELRNIPTSKQSEKTDIYSIGCTMKHVTPFGLPFSNFVLLSKEMKHYDSNK